MAQTDTSMTPKTKGRPRKPVPLEHQVAVELSPEEFSVWSKAHRADYDKQAWKRLMASRRRCKNRSYQQVSHDRRHGVPVAASPLPAVAHGSQDGLQAASGFNMEWLQSAPMRLLSIDLAALGSPFGPPAPLPSIPSTTVDTEIWQSLNTDLLVDWSQALDSFAEAVQALSPEAVLMHVDPLAELSTLPIDLELDLMAEQAAARSIDSAENDDLLAGMDFLSDVFEDFDML